MAAPNIPLSAFGDLNQGTLAHYEFLRVTDIMSPNDMSDYVFMSLVLNDAQVKTIPSGKSIVYEVMLNNTGSAENVGLGYQDNPQITDVLAQATVDWRHSKVDWASVKQVDQMNAEPARIVDIKMVQEKAAMHSMMELMETNAFGPSVTSTDTLTPWGFKTWLTRQNSGAAYSADGFVGGTLTGGPTKGLTDQTKWRNYYFQYTNVSDDDFIRRISTALRKCNFKSPVKGIPEIGPGLKRVYFTNHSVLQSLEELLKASNQNIGVDVVKYHNMTMLKGNPVVYVPYLDADTTNPIFGVNLPDVTIYRLKNFWMRKAHYDMYPGQHNNEADFLDCTYQVAFTNLRKSFVGATSYVDPT